MGSMQYSIAWAHNMMTLSRVLLASCLFSVPSLVQRLIVSLLWMSTFVIPMFLVLCNHCYWWKGNCVKIIFLFFSCYVTSFHDIVVLLRWCLLVKGCWVSLFWSFIQVVVLDINTWLCFQKPGSSFPQSQH